MRRYSSAPLKLIPKGQYCPYSSKVTFKLKNDAAKDYANDGTGKHTHVGTQQCILADRDTKKCPTVCSQPTILEVDGHNTHKPPVGRVTRFISPEDVNGSQQPQYFVPTNKKSEMTEQQKQAYGKDFKLDQNAQSYIEKYKDKYEP